MNVYPKDSVSNLAYLLQLKGFDVDIVDPQVRVDSPDGVVLGDMTRINLNKKYILCKLIAHWFLAVALSNDCLGALKLQDTDTFETQEPSTLGPGETKG